MTALEDIRDYYANLLIAQYKAIPDNYAFVQGLVEPLLIDQMPVAVMNAFSIADAIGDQLDVVGKYIGVVRSVKINSTTYVTLSDADFRTLIKIAIIRNCGKSSLGDIQDALFANLAGRLVAYDQANMQMNYFANSSLGSLDLIKSLIVQNLLPKPMGVQLSSVVYVDFIANLFGYRTYAAAGVGISYYNTYSSYSMASPWLRYTNVVTL